MVMTAEVVAVDGELALILPEELLRKLGVGIGAEIKVEETERGVRIVGVHRAAKDVTPPPTPPRS